MSDYEFTEAAKEELDFECSDCGKTEMPDITDYHLTVECECGRETEANVWDKDVKEE